MTFNKKTWLTGDTITAAELNRVETGISDVDTNKADVNHNHDGVYEPIFTKNSAFNKSFGTTAGTVSEGNHTHAELHTHTNITTLDKLTDNGTSLLFNGSTIGGSGGGVTTLDGLTDVDTSTTTPIEGNVLKYIGGIWKPGTDNTGGGSGGSADTMNVYNAKNHGLVGNNSTDDSAAFNALVLQVYNDGGGVIYLPKGNYMLDSSVYWLPNVSLVGDGVGKTIIKTRKNGATYQVNLCAITWNSGATSAPYNLYGGNGNAGQKAPFENCHFSNFEIDGSNVVSTDNQYSVAIKGIFIQYLRNCTFRNLYIHDTIATGLGVDFLDKSLIENVIVKNCGRGFGVMTGGTLGGAGIGIGTGGMASENLVIANCQADGNGSYGIFTEDQSIFDGAFTYTGQGIIIANCIVKNTRNYGIGIKGGKGITVTNNQSYNNTKSGVYLNTVTLDSLVLTGNVIYGNVTSGVELNYSPSTISVKNIRITENIIKSNTVDGITFNGGTFENITISNNTLTENNIGLQVKGTNTFTNLTFERNLVKKNNSEGFVITTATNTINGLFIQFNKFIDNSVTASNKNAITLWNSATNISITDNIAWDTNATGSKKQNAGFGILGSPTFTNGQIMRNDFRFNIVTSGYVSTITQNILTNVVNDFLTPMGALYAPNTTINRYISLPKEVADFTGSTNFVIDVKFKYNGSNIVFLSKHNTAYTTDTRPKGWYFATSGAKLKLEGSAADATNALNLTGSTTLVSGNIYWARVVLDGTAATLKIQLSTDGTTYTDETVTGTLTAANVISVLGNADDMPSKIGVRYAGSTGFTDYYKNSEIHFINLFKVAAVTTGTPTMQYKFTNYGMNRNVIDEILGVSGTSYGLEQIKVY